MMKQSYFEFNFMQYVTDGFVESYLPRDMDESSDNGKYEQNSSNNN